MGAQAICQERYRLLFAIALRLRPALIRASRVLPSTPPLFHNVERHFVEGQFGGFYLFLFQTPHYSERVATFAGADESAVFHRLDGIAIGRQRAYFFIIFQVPQNWVAAERISFKLVSMLDVRKAGLVQSR
jgi:hypothetical protein